MKEHVTPHADWCQGKDAKVWWDEEGGLSVCHECGAITEEQDTDTEVQMTPEVVDGDKA